MPDHDPTGGAPQPFDGHDVPEELRARLGETAPDLADFRRLCAALAYDAVGVDQVLAEVAATGRALLVLLCGAADYVKLARDVHGAAAEAWLNARAMRQLDTERRVWEHDDD